MTFTRSNSKSWYCLVLVSAFASWHVCGMVWCVLCAVCVRIRFKPSFVWASDIHPDSIQFKLIIIIIIMISINWSTVCALLSATRQPHPRQPNPFNFYFIFMAANASTSCHNPMLGWETVEIQAIKFIWRNLWSVRMRQYSAIFINDQEFFDTNSFELTWPE